MGSNPNQSVVLVTGAGGHIGSEVCRLLRSAGSNFLPLDVCSDSVQNVLACDLTGKDEISRLFDCHSVGAVIHLAAVLPSSFRSDPLRGADVNLTTSFELLRQAVNTGTKRFVFASSMSVYGSSAANHPLTEDDAAYPDEPYGASKRAVELVGQDLVRDKSLEFVSLRIARVVGAGIRNTSSLWRSEIFETCSGKKSISIPFASNAVLSLVHVEDVARMLVTLLEIPQMRSPVYNTPVELWQAQRLKELVEQTRKIRVELREGESDGGPICNGSRFAIEFAFRARALRDRICTPAT